ncbi:N-acetylmuramoyl-L-alanine amidase [Ruminiclostridium sufflavum DSM 19573]|uniref:N-acetylmuramoyl-L-alanine amidase n=1 Tax=Ruminiclostridium sufflavum DSM 19573 TaxID=1121337 RepID=A0A318XK77_9FIRM|nr:N-acetylmuramoyl-L-alanine amidase [Ruminiclostridium sufflavum]PYG85827.1 N-acetylmuramoyl-L-alanine amidase [Ruminiclostridium sufflavum DSM 19573]
MKKYKKKLLILSMLFLAIGLVCTACTLQSQRLTSEADGNEEASQPASVRREPLSPEASLKPSQVSSEANISQPSVSSKAVKKEEKQPLDGLTVCIDAGHGRNSNAADKKEPVAPGSDIMKAAFASGTSGVSTKISEASLNLIVSKKLKKVLTDKGADIIMIREDERCDLTNVDRAKLWNSSGADLAIRIHANGINDSKVSGVLMMVPGNKYIKDRDMLDKSALIGQCVLSGVLKYTKAKSRGTVKSNDITGFNWSEIPVALLEMGFMTNPEEDKLLNTEEYQNKIVSGIAEGLEKYKSSIIAEASANDN